MKRLLNSFGFAFKGLMFYLRSGGNVNIHLLATLLVLMAGFYFQISRTEWIQVMLCIFAVHSAEAFNTSLEQLMNFLSPEHHPMAGRVKDLAAAAVLLITIGAAITGALVFLPYLIEML